MLSRVYRNLTGPNEGASIVGDQMYTRMHAVGSLGMKNDLEERDKVLMYALIASRFIFQFNLISNLPQIVQIRKDRPSGKPCTVCIPPTRYIVNLCTISIKDYVVLLVLLTLLQFSSSLGSVEDTAHKQSSTKRSSSTAQSCTDARGGHLTIKSELSD